VRPPTEIRTLTTRLLSGSQRTHLRTQSQFVRSRMNCRAKHEPRNENGEDENSNRIAARCRYAGTCMMAQLRNDSEPPTDQRVDGLISAISFRQVLKPPQELACYSAL
jgi:hypothetical protein